VSQRHLADQFLETLPASGVLGGDPLVVVDEAHALFMPAQLDRALE